MSASNSIFYLMLVAGFAGGLGHCSGMCGPLVILLSPREAGWGRSLRLHGGRWISYALIGGSLASLTSVLAIEATALPFRRLAMAFAGLVLALSGLATIGLPLFRGQWIQRWLGAGPIRWASLVARTGGHLALGLFWGLLPCGLLYSAYAAAAGAGAAAANPLIAWLRGAGVMLLFALGTTPSLLGIAWAAKQLPLAWRAWLQRLAGLVVLVSGVVLLWQAFAPGP